MKLVCIGDSITKGQMSADYTRMLEKRCQNPITIINAGVNGDLAYNVFQRLEGIIKQNPDCITLLIGTNDVLATRSDRAAKQYIRKKKLPERPSRQWFASNLEAIVTRLQKETRAAIALLSLPLITEDRTHELFQRSIEYSTLIKAVAEKKGVAYLPLNERQQTFLHSANTVPHTEYDGTNNLMAKAILAHWLLGRKWDDISRKYGLALTTDHVHQNSVGAGMIAELILELSCLRIYNPSGS